MDQLLGRERLPTDRAIELHETVPPAKWCITFVDLKFFQSEVQRALRAQTFPETDSEHGPSIYAVNEHYIMPVTAAAGKMSWALMRNPRGLDCDLFISHAWQEGVFEFTRKVIASWPWLARHAWCCMLANPQHLDIGALLQSPSSSPFALALQTSKYMLVVPNQHRSVYTRLWCGYEAYIAFQSNKIIQTATPRVWDQVLFSWFWMFPALFIGLAVGGVSNASTTPIDDYLVRLITVLAILASLVSQNSGHIKLCLVENHIGLAAAVAVACCASDIAFPLHPASMTLELDALTRAEIVAYFLLSEVDSVNWQADLDAEAELRNEFQGSLRHAACSEVQDEENIWTEISDQRDEVDKVIQVLLKAGMTSDALRHAYLQGVELQHAGVIQWAIPVLVLGPGVAMECFLMGHFAVRVFDTDEDVTGVLWYPRSLQFVSLFARLSLLTLLFRRSIDERCWMLNVMAKTVAPSLLCRVAVGFLTKGPLLSAAWILYYISMLVAWLFAALGIRGALKLPCGRLVADFFLRRVVGCGSSSRTSVDPLDSVDEESESDSSSET